jgi:putative transposase
MEFTCWNNEVVRIAFAMDCHDREVIAPRPSPGGRPFGMGSLLIHVVARPCHRWTATTAGISGKLIRDLMIACVEQRFGAMRTPHPIQWLSDNGSVYAAVRTIDLATALGLVPCFTPIESPTASPKPS